MNDPFVGELMLFGGNFAPVGWLPCDGRLLSISAYEVLFVLLGTTYGGDGQTTFALPDLRGTAPIHRGQAPGMSNYIQGQRVGLETVTLASMQMPAHSHGITATVKVAACNTDEQDATSPVGGYLRKTTGTSTYASTANALSGPSPLQGSTAALGGNNPFNICGPTLTMTYCIATEGVFPPQY